MHLAALASSAPLVLLLGNGAEEQAPPVIDLDGTALIQFALFVVMYFVLKRLLFEPFLAMKKMRSAGIEGAREEAAQMEQRAESLGKDYEGRLQAARSKSDDERLRLRAQGQERERELLTQTRSLTQAQLQAARLRIADEGKAAQAQLQQQALPLSRQIASKVLGREV